jgi:hypothetical protein
MLGEESGRKALIDKVVLGTNHQRPKTGRSATDNVLIHDRKQEQVCHAV